MGAPTDAARPGVLANPVLVLNVLLNDPQERLIRTRDGDAFHWHLLQDGRAVDPRAADKLRGQEAPEFYGGRLIPVEADAIPARPEAAVVFVWQPVE